jgi:hypothetical protein
MLTVAIATIVVLTVASLALLFWPDLAADPAADDMGNAEASSSGAVHPIEDERPSDER